MIAHRANGDVVLSAVPAQVLRTLVVELPLVQHGAVRRSNTYSRLFAAVIPPARALYDVVPSASFDAPARLVCLLSNRFCSPGATPSIRASFSVHRPSRNKFRVQRLYRLHQFRIQRGMLTAIRHATHRFHSCSNEKWPNPFLSGLPHHEPRSDAKRTPART